MTHTPQPWSGIVGLTGPGGATALVSGLLYQLYGFRTFGLKDVVRGALLTVDPMLSSDLSLAQLLERTDWEGAETHRIHGPEVRRLLASLGTDLGRTYFGDGCWTRLLEDEIADAGGFSAGHPVVVDDVTFDDEAQWVRDLGGWVWHVQAGPDDAGVDPLLVDHVIVLGEDAGRLLAQIDALLAPVVSPPHRPADGPGPSAR